MLQIELWYFFAVVKFKREYIVRSGLQPNPWTALYYMLPNYNATHAK